ncbi:hypothetical protein [Actinomadura napierensis]|uniref:hypothetical protein n=1 Tax=Actinomadura napierensis TaxID=267854 RepID=UPI0031D3A90B
MVDRSTGERHLAVGDTAPLVVADLQPERLEKPPEHRLGSAGQVHLAYRDQVEQFGAGADRTLPLVRRQLVELRVPLGRERRRALTDVAHQVTVAVFEEFEFADQASPSRLDVVDRLTQCFGLRLPLSRPRVLGLE